MSYKTKEEEEALGACVALVILWGLASISVNYLLSKVGVNIPFIGDIVIGVIFPKPAWLIAAAVIVWVLSLSGVL